MKFSCLCLLGAGTKGVCQYIHLARKVFIIRHKREISQESLGKSKAAVATSLGQKGEGRLTRARATSQEQRKELNRGKPLRL